MKSSHIDTSTLLDRLEKKYAKKLKNQKNKRQAKQQRQVLTKVRGMSVPILMGKSSTLFELDYEILQ
jgi:hypothetical protein